MTRPHENLLREEADARVDVVHAPAYRIELDLTGDDETFTARVHLTFTSQPGASTFLDCTAAEVSRVELNGVELGPDVVEPTRIQLPDLRDHNEVVVESTMRYTREGRGLHHFRDPSDGVAYLHSQFEPFDAHTVFACFDQPDLKATYELAVDAPADWVVVSNMPTTSRPEEGAAGRWEFAPTPKLSTYLVAIVAGGYSSVSATHGDMDMALYCRRSLAHHLDPDEIFEITRQGLDWFGEAFDFPYPFAKYDQLFVPEFAMGAMEHPGCVTFTESYVFRSKVTDAARERRAETILHEMAHMWFGDLVTMQWWDDLWLNESFATFMAILAMAESTRFTNAWVTFLDSEKAWAKYQDQLPTTHPIAADAPDVETANQNFDGITYAKGASVLRQLVAWVGQEAFLEGCREYFRKHAWGNATLTDFLAALEGASGRDLDAWRDDWLLTTGVNTLAATRPSGDTAGPITIRQVTGDGHPEPRPHRLQVGLYGDEDGKLVRYAAAEVDVVAETTLVDELVDEAAPSVLVLNDADLTYAKVVLDPDTVEVLTDRLHEVVDPLTRALLWSATWDMVRDAQMPARRFAAQVAANADSESDVGVLQRLLARAIGAVDRYGDPGNREAALGDLAANARRATLDAAPGSDHQLAWLRHWASTARDELSRSEILAVLEGDTTIRGVSLDTDLRWHLVGCLASAGAIGPDRIAQELERDQTDLGARAAAAAHAMLPDQDQKQQAWDRLLHADDLSHTMARELYKGFGQLHQAEILAAFRGPWFDAVPTVTESRGMDVAVEFVEATFPHANPSDELVEQVDRLLDTSLPGPITRALLEQQDVLKRTLRARRTDAAA